MTLFFCGDIMPGGVLPYQNSYIAPELLSYMRSFDYRIGTLEAAIGTNMPFDPVKLSERQNIIYARDDDFFRLKEMGFNVVSLANNHVWDLGEDGLVNTIRLLDESGIKHCGAGLNAEEASKPVVIEKDGLRIAILAYCMFGNKYLGHVELAGKDKAGVNPLIIDKVVVDIRKMKQEYDRVIVMPHWGREYLCEPLFECIKMAKQMVLAGADAIVGSHPHQVQPFVYLKGNPVCFSLGNFLFPDFYMYPPRPIWYPDSVEETQSVEDIVGYPFPIEKPVRQVWNASSRYGCTIGVEFDKNLMSVSLRHVHLSEDNIETLSDLPTTIQHQLNKADRVITCAPIRMLVYFRRRIRNIVRELSIKFGK